MLPLRSETDKVHIFQKQTKKLKKQQTNTKKQTDSQTLFFTCVGQRFFYMRWAANPYENVTLMNVLENDIVKR